MKKRKEGRDLEEEQSNKGLIADIVNLMLAAATFNLKKLMRKPKYFFVLIVPRLQIGFYLKENPNFEVILLKSTF